MALNSSATERKIDIVFCIDGTGSMSPCLDAIKNNAKKFYMDFVDKLTNEFGSSVDELNIKVITFRDYVEDGTASMVQSEWYDITAGDDIEYEKHLNGIVADGGGDEPENGLEALFYAMTTDWNARGDKDRQVIVLFTDADAVPFGTQVGHPNYPADMVDMDGLLCTWMGHRPAFMGQGDFKLRDKCKRLVMFAPAGTIYETLNGSFNRSQFTPVQMDAGLGDMNFDDIIKIIAASASAV